MFWALPSAFLFLNKGQGLPSQVRSSILAGRLLGLPGPSGCPI